MPFTVLIHIANEDAIVGEIDEMPGSEDLTITVKNPRKRDGKDLNYLQNEVTTVVWPWSRINFIEMLPSDADEEIIGFVRE